MLLCLGLVRTQQSFNKWGLVKLNSAVHKNTGHFASLTKRARSTSFLLINSVNILLRSKKRKKKPEMGGFHVSKLLFLRVQIPGGGVLPYTRYMGMCRCEGYGFQAV